MSAEQAIPNAPLEGSGTGLWDRISDFATRNRKTIFYTVGATTVLITAGGVWYYYQSQNGKDGDSEAKRKKTRGKRKQKQPTADEESQGQPATGGSAWVKMTDE